MPTTMTYNSLVADLKAYLNRSDAAIIAQIPEFINLAQIRIPRELKILGFRQEVTGNFDATAQSSGLMTKPSDWMQMIAFYTGTGTNNSVHTPVLKRDYSYIRTVYPDPTVQDIPRFYGDADYDHWLVQPSPSSALPFKLVYYGSLVLLDSSNQTNWLTKHAPDAILYASLLEAVPYLKADERIVVWQGLYTNAKTMLQTQEMELKFDTAAVVGEPQPPSVMPH